VLTTLSFTHSLWRADQVPIPPEIKTLSSDDAIILHTPRLRDAVWAHHERRRVVSVADQPAQVAMVALRGSGA